MTKKTTQSRSDNGYGDKDRQLADALRTAESTEDADRIARDDGLRDARDAASWLKERSSPPEMSESPSASHSPEMAKLLGTDTPEGAARFDRLAHIRDAGWTGSLDGTNRIPDPDNPANGWFVRTMKPAEVASMREWRAKSPEYRGA